MEKKIVFMWKSWSINSKNEEEKEEKDCTDKN